MTTNTDSNFEPLAVSCARVGLSYWIAWRLATSGKVATKRDARGRWFVRAADLRPFVELVTVGGPEMR